MTDAETIRHLWTHKTQDHPFLSDEELVIDRAEGVWVWTERGKKLMDGFAGLAVVNVGHGRREIAEAIAEQTVRLAYYPTTRQFSNRPAAELAAKLATLTPGDLTYTMFAVSGSEANERSMQIARHYWLAKGRAGKHKMISFQGGYHGATTGTFAVCGLPAHGPALRGPAGAGVREGGGAASVSRSRGRDGRGTDPAPGHGAPGGDRPREPGHRLGGDPGADPLIRWLHHPAAGMAPRRAFRLRRAGCADDRRRGHHRLRTDWPVVRVRPRGRGARPDVGGEGHHLGIRPALGEHRATPSRRRLLRDHDAGERAPEHLRGASRGLRGGARQPQDHGAGRPRGQRRADGRAAAGGPPERRGQAADRRRGARARDDGLCRLRGAGRLAGVPSTPSGWPSWTGRRGIGGPSSTRGGPCCAWRPRCASPATRWISSSASWPTASTTSSGTSTR